MFKRIILALLFSLNLQAMQIPLLTFEYTIGSGLKGLQAAFMGLPVGGKVAVVGGCIVAGGLVYMAGTKWDKLPRGGSYPYEEPKHWVEQKPPRDEAGRYVDANGDAWEWDPIKGEWDVQINRSRGDLNKGDHININTEGEETHGGKLKCEKLDLNKPSHRMQAIEDIHNAAEKNKRMEELFKNFPKDKR